MPLVPLLDPRRYHQSGGADQLVLREAAERRARPLADHAGHVGGAFVLVRGAESLRMVTQGLHPQRPVQRQVLLPQRSDQPGGAPARHSTTHDVTLGSTAAMRSASRRATSSLARRGQVSIPSAETIDTAFSAPPMMPVSGETSLA